jgi:hypothetical protein
MVSRFKNAIAVISWLQLHCSFLNFTTNAADVKNLRHLNIAAAVVVCVVPTKNVLHFLFLLLQISSYLMPRLLEPALQ